MHFFLQILKVVHKSFPMMYQLSYLDIKHGIQRGGANWPPPSLNLFPLVLEPHRELSYQPVKTTRKDARMKGYEYAKMQGYKDTKIQRCKDTKMKRCKDTRMQRCKDARIQRWKDTRTQRCKDEKIQGCKDAKMQGYKDENIQGHKDVKIQGYRMKHLRNKIIFRQETLLFTDSSLQICCRSNWGTRKS